MMTDRRTFLKHLGALALTFACNPLEAINKGQDKRPNKTRQLTILHTNDVHSQIDPIVIDTNTNTTMGGYARRKAYIDMVRNEGNDMLVFECGDMFQGTPYFNVYNGKLEIDLMNKMGIDAVTIGNHEFDNGLDALTQRIKEANFPFLNANYNFKSHEMASVVKPYKIFEKAGMKIGVIGIGVKLDGLVSYTNYGETTYSDPIETANTLAKELRNNGCNLIIVLSHIGYKMTNLPDDILLARSSTDIDIILGGHTHTLLHQPTEVKNKNGRIVVINQVGSHGINMGRIDITIAEDNTLSMSSPGVRTIC